MKGTYSRSVRADMPDPAQLHHLVRLLDDDSPIVREEVMKGFAAFGPLLTEELTRQRIRLTETQRSALEPILDEHNREWLMQAWPTWMNMKGDKARLEGALSLLADFLYSRLHLVTLATALDELAESFMARNATANAIELARFLFHEQGLSGVSLEDYYNPQSSNLLHVIGQKRGLPISLACIYILTGHRVGVRIEGCNFPGHFLAIASLQRQKVLVDCFNGGRFIREEDLSAIHADVSLNDILRLECRSTMIIARVLRNLMYAYKQSGKNQNAQLAADLLAPLLSGTE